MTLTAAELLKMKVEHGTATTTTTTSEDHDDDDDDDNNNETVAGLDKLKPPPPSSTVVHLGTSIGLRKTKRALLLQGCNCSHKSKAERK
jgi:hypothetical protein